MDFFKHRTTIDFLGQRKLAVGLSLVLILASIVSFAVRGVNLGLDFTGGTVIEVAYAQPVGLDGVRQTLAQAGYPEAVVQHFGTARDVMVRIAPRPEEASADLSTRVLRALQDATAERVEMRRVEFVGPQVGEELREDGGLAMLIALFGILIYVALRFEYRFAMGAVAALVHDVVITLGVFSVFQLEFNLTVLAALLAVIGYSLNDTIVVFDRVRENFRKMRKGSTVDTMNAALNQNLSRTVMTSVTTMLVLLTLLWLGGPAMFGFALALVLGVIIGTYSSIYVASTVALALGVSKADLMVVKKEGAEADDRP
jgi:preprotein translocase subunit SecF